MMQQQNDGETKYSIDTTWFEENNYSFVDFVRARMCESCVGRLGEETEERYTVLDKKTGRATFDFRTVAYGSDPARVIQDCCSKKKEFILPDMATLEAIFRVYLAGGNAPMSVDDVREQLAEWCPGGGCQWLLLPIDALERLVHNDTHYGIRPSRLPAAA